MRKLQTTIVSFGLVVSLGFGQLLGCSADADDCSLNATCNADGTPYSGSVGPLPECMDSPSANPAVIRDECAFFVGGSAASDGNAGTQAAPFKSLSTAINAARNAKARVYLCGIFTERVDIPAGVSLFGGFDCLQAEWKYDASRRARIEAPAPSLDSPFQSSMRILGMGATRVEDIDIQATVGSFAGSSAIGVIINGPTVDFVRSTITASDGEPGAKGATPTDDVGPADPNDPAVRGNPGQNACFGGSGGNPGGAAVVNVLCPESVGGKGGNGQDMSGDPGENGLPTDSMFGQGGPGENVTSCIAGANGRLGMSGNFGAGGKSVGTLDEIKGHIGSSGQAGGKGTVGQGAGGGGGAKGKTNFFGASGGSGGAGGCPGNGGLGGEPGGSSIGIVSLAGTLRFLNVAIVTGYGGMGGAGGTGQNGGAGGNGGFGGKGGSCGGGAITTAACDGANGGNGGSGGQGGGGAGGHSWGIAHAAKTTLDLSGVTITTAMPGDGGAGGDLPGTGAAGLQEDVHEFP
ncbi:MAG TPA: hypothetical protein PK156_06815 [Polyangium sp.]|nr:hypothetical protein [Polyangium sp.]